LWLIAGYQRAAVVSIDTYGESAPAVLFNALQLHA
jgi:hypothetical protein